VDSERAIVANIIQQKQEKVYLKIVNDLAATSGSREPYVSTGSLLNSTTKSFMVS
jgi:Mor family transcriptional regulator